MTSIYVYDFGEITDDEWKGAEEILLSYSIKPIYVGKLKVPEFAWNPQRRQWNAQEFLKVLANHKTPSLGLTKLDIFYDELNFVFGLASPTAKVGIVSFARLSPEFWGEPNQPELYIKRIKKEVLHEVGHILGLVHCSVPGCVMNFSNSVADVDRKTERFCRYCESQVRSLVA